MPNKPVKAAAPTKRAKIQKNRRRDYRRITEILINLEAGNAGPALGYYRTRRAGIKWAKYDAIVRELEAGRLGLAIDYCRRKARALEAFVAGECGDLHLSLVELWHAETRRLTNRVNEVVNALDACDKGNIGPLKQYAQRRLTQLTTHRDGVKAKAESAQAILETPPGSEREE